MNVNEKAAYLHGLFDGYDLDRDSKEVKLIGEILDMLSVMAQEISDLKAENAELREYIEEIDEDLGAVEEELYFTDDDDDDDDDDYDDLNDDEEFEADEDSVYYEVECPSCGEVVCFDDSLDPTDLACPACGEKIGEIEIVDEEE